MARKPALRLPRTPSGIAFAETIWKADRRVPFAVVLGAVADIEHEARVGREATHERQQRLSLLARAEEPGT